MDNETRKYLIVNADDFGYSRGRNAGILHCIREGRVTSISVLVNGSALEEIADLMKTASEKNISIGLHFNITEGVPLSSGLSTLTDSTGVFRGKFGLRSELERGTVSQDEVAGELRFQIKKFSELTGTLPNHVDGHQHIHIWKGVREVFLDVLIDYGIRKCRVPQELGIAECSWIDSQTLHFYNKVVQEASVFKQLCKDYGVAFTHCFVGMQCMGNNMTLRNIANGILQSYSCVENNLSDVFCELMVHPGFKSNEPGGCSSAPDSFELSPDRLYELEFLCGPQFQEFLRDSNITLCSYDILR